MKRLSNQLRDAYPDVEWKKIAGMRDKVVHFYFWCISGGSMDRCYKGDPRLERRIGSIVDDYKDV